MNYQQTNGTTSFTTICLSKTRTHSSQNVKQWLAQKIVLYSLYRMSDKDVSNLRMLNETF